MLLVLAHGPPAAGQVTVNDRLQAKLQENIDSPWPGITDPNNAAGVFSYALACLHLNQNVAQANQLLLDFYTNNPIPAYSGGRDEWNGYFWQHILWRAYHDPAAGSRMTAPTRELIEDNMWSWLETRSSLSEAQQNVWKIYDSENHDAMTKGSHLMCLIALKNSPRYGADIVFPDGGTIADHLSAWTAFYMRYFRARAQEGINVEIACQQYARYTVGAYYNIMDFAESAELRALAKTFIDLYWADTASDWLSSGVRGGGQTRCYREGSYLRNGTSYSFHGLTWAYGWHDNEASIRTYPMIQAVSSYRIPDIITACATDPARPGFLYTSRRFGRGGGWDSNKDYTVVFDNGDSNLRRDTWVTPDYSMGSFTVDMNRDYIALIDQNRVMGVMFAAGVNERIMVFGQGGADPTKSFADISGVTRENCTVVQRDRNVYSSGTATQLYVSPLAWANRVEANGWLFTQLGNAYCAIKPANGGYSSAAAGSGVNLTLDDLWSPVVIQTGQAGDYSSFADFQASVPANAFTYSSGTANYTSEAGDTFTFYANSKTTPRVNGITVDLNPAKTYDSPYLSMVHGGEVATFAYTGYPDLVMDFGYDPDISSLSPAHTATGVAPDANLILTFSEEVVAGSGFIRLWRSDGDVLLQSFDVSQTSEVVIAGAQVTLNPTANLADATSYYVTIDATAFEDLQGNSFAGLAGSADWSFTTLSERAIQVVRTGSRVVASALGNSSTSFSFDAGATAEMLVVAVSSERSTETTYTVSYAGHALNTAIEAVQAGVWYLDLRGTGYAGGAADLVVDFSGVTTVNGVAIGAVSVQANGYDIELHATASGTESATLVTSVGETFQVASFNANGSGSPSVNAPLTTIYASGNIGSAQGAAGYRTSAVAGSHDCSWTTSEKRKVAAAAFVVANSFANWAAGFELGAETGPGDDPDGDGLSNALEAWFGTHPGEAGKGIGNLATDQSATTFTHPVGDLVPDDLQTGYQWSTNLGEWYDCDGLDGPAGGVRVSASAQSQDGIATVTLTASEAMGNLFLRLLVDQTP